MFFKKREKDEIKNSIETFKRINGRFWRSKLLQVWREENYSTVPTNIVEGLKKAKDLNINLNSI